MATEVKLGPVQTRRIEAAAVTVAQRLKEEGRTFDQVFGEDKDQDFMFFDAFMGTDVFDMVDGLLTKHIKENGLDVSTYRSKSQAEDKVIDAIWDVAVPAAKRWWEDNARTASISFDEDGDPIFDSVYRDSRVASYGPMSGEVVVFTGDGKVHGKEFSRAQLTKMAIESGATAVHSSITKDTTLLVAADPNSASNKARKARERGVKVISVGEFIETCSSGTKSGVASTVVSALSTVANRLAALKDVSYDEKQVAFHTIVPIIINNEIKKIVGCEDLVGDYGHLKKGVRRSKEAFQRFESGKQNLERVGIDGLLERVMNIASTKGAKWGVYHGGPYPWITKSRRKLTQMVTEEFNRMLEVIGYNLRDTQPTGTVAALKDATNKLANRLASHYLVLDDDRAFPMPDDIINSSDWAKARWHLENALRRSKLPEGNAKEAGEKINILEDSRNTLYGFTQMRAGDRKKMGTDFDRIEQMRKMLQEIKNALITKFPTLAEDDVL